jgi:hypothetical protein
MGKVALAELAIVDDVDADLGLVSDNLSNSFGQVLDSTRSRHCAGVRDQNALGTAAHALDI